MNRLATRRAKGFVFSLSCCAFASGAFASDTIKVNRSATYQLNNSASTKMQDQCKLDSQIVESLVRYAKGRVEVTDQDLSQLEGQTLTLLITDAFAAGGGGWSGPKWAYVDATLKQGDHVIDHFLIGSKTGGGGHMTACGALGKVGKALGAKVAKRLLRAEKKKSAGVAPDDKSEADDAEDADVESNEPTR